MLTPNIKKKLKSLYPEHVFFKKDGTVDILKSYFYRFDYSEKKLAEDVTEKLSKHGFTIKVNNKWDNFASWRGGQSLRAGSHFGVNFTVESYSEEPVKTEVQPIVVKNDGSLSITLDGKDHKVIF